jgi:hypothetical protein
MSATGSAPRRRESSVEEESTWRVVDCLIGMETCSGTHFGSWSRCASDPGAVREAVPQGTQERLPRCRGNRGGGATADDAVRVDQDDGADGFAALHRVRSRLVRQRTVRPPHRAWPALALNHGVRVSSGRDRAGPQSAVPFDTTSGIDESWREWRAD